MYGDKIKKKEYDEYVKHGYIQFALALFLILKCFITFCFVFSLGLDVTCRVLKQRIYDIEQEYKRKYNDAKEQLKHDARLTVDAIVHLD